MFHSKKPLFLLFAAFVLTINCVFAEEAKIESAPSTTDIKAAYPLDKCIVSDEKFTAEMGNPVILNYNGREIKLCCKGCVKDFEKNPDKYLLRLDKAIVKAQKASYPIETCVVSDEKLGGMGDPIEYIYNNQLVRFCCKGCVSTFEKDPAKYLAKLSKTSTTPETH